MPRRPRNKPFILDDIGQALDRLADAGQLLRRRLDTIDPIEHPARWSAVNDEIRALDDRIVALRGEQQHIALSHAELTPLADADLEALRVAITQLADLVRAADRVALVAEAAVRLAEATGTAIQKVRQGRSG